ncbi:peptide-methionine (S)-S-oxide reductase MsrA [Fretibacter rubidus]|uniref:peptide-methionine (S)-S-oxide reductase MsrA n=1 Tax=Fretibacter rubidus TaxID=570162 RepID=UPI00352B7B4D
MKTSFLIAAAMTLAACSSANPSSAETKEDAAPVTLSGQTDTAILAGGCFWCVESDFEKLPGVIEVVSGYTGGTTDNPTYKNHTSTGHYEAGKIIFDPTVISYNQLLDFYWTSVDPTDPNGQFCDKGPSYRTAIFARPDQIDAARENKAGIEITKPFSDPIVTPVLVAQPFYDAEDYHQDYYKKNPIRYKYYRNGCRRDARLEQLWGDKAHSKP